jgi:hypothetical protein
MKKILLIILTLFSFSVYAQFKNTGIEAPSVKDGIVDQSVSSQSLFGFLNSDNFMMKHSYELSYSAFGGQGFALGVYTNSMFFKINPDLNIQTDISVVNSPYSTLGRSFQNNLNGIYLSRAALNYQPFKDVSISLEYNRLPGGYNPFYFGGSSFGGFSRYSPWGY